MKVATIKTSRRNKFLSPRIFVIAGMIFAVTLGAAAQGSQLSLADLLIGLRSKKVSLQDRNKILTEAVQERGITFLLSPEIEKELSTTGAAPELIAALRDKTATAKAASPKPIATPAPTPTPPDFSFFKARADASAVKGDFVAALTDYNKSIELKTDDATAYFSRGRAHFNLKSFTMAIADFDRSIALDPKDVSAYMNRAVSYERLGQAAKAVADYEKVTVLDPANEQAKASLKRLNDEIAAAAERAKPKPEPVKPPEFISRGTLTAEQAIKLVTPSYSSAAQRASVEGKVIIEVELDTEGNVIAAKATSGHQMLRSSAEEAAERSKFQPAMFDNKPIKSKGVLVYNFSLKGK